MIDDISGVILAGGTNRRFNGLIKSNIVLGGKSIISRITDTLDEIFSNIIIVTNTPEAFKGLDKFLVIGDRFRNVGPLGGIHAALMATRCSACFVFAGDMPLLNGELIIRQTEYYRQHNCDALIPRSADFIEPLHAIYNRKILDSLEDYLTQKQGYAVRMFLRTIDVAYFDLLPSDTAGSPFTNINYPEDIDGLKDI